MSIHSINDQGVGKVFTQNIIFSSSNKATRRKKKKKLATIVYKNNKYKNKGYQQKKRWMTAAEIVFIFIPVHFCSFWRLSAIHCLRWIISRFNSLFWFFTAITSLERRSICSAYTLSHLSKYSCEWSMTNWLDERARRKHWLYLFRYVGIV